MENEQLSEQTTPETQPDPILTKEQKVYEKKLKQYEKEKARWEYFQANKERILKNQQAIKEYNTMSADLNYEIESDSVKQIKNYWFIPMDKVLMTIDKAIIEIKKLNAGRDGWMYFVKEVNESSPEELWGVLIGCELTHLDKKYNFIPKLIGAYGHIYSNIPIWSVNKDYYLNLFGIFSIPNLPKKPIPPEKPKPKEIKQQLSELKQEVVQIKEMDISRKVYGDTVPTKLEVISNGKTIKVEKETYDLYIKYKATRKERLYDLDLSFDHFKATYLDKHPKFMRKGK